MTLSKELLERIDTFLSPKDRSAELQSALTRRFGHPSFRQGQLEIIQRILDGENLLIMSPTGYGKSLCYQLPALLMEGMAIVVSPLIALMKDQVDQLRARGIHEVALLNSSLSLEQQQSVLERLRQGEIKLLYVSPERFRSQHFITTLKQMTISLFVVDEAHCISQWGHDFRPAYLALRDVLRTITCNSIALFTATATVDVQRDILTQLGISAPSRSVPLGRESLREWDESPFGNCSVVSLGIGRENLKFSVITVQSEEEKFTALENILSSLVPSEGLLSEKGSTLTGKGIIYTGRRREAETVAEFVKTLHRKADFYHAGLPAADRMRVQEKFFHEGRESIEIVAATNAFGLGIDKANIRFVIHWTMPGTLEAYYQEAGRAGRDGKSAYCILLYSPDDRDLQEWFIDQDIPTKKKLIKLMRLIENTPRYESFRFVDPQEAEWQSGLDDTSINVGIAHLERLGFLRRHPNIPASISLRWHTTKLAPETFRELPRDDTTIETVHFCHERSLAPTRLMQILLDYQFDGILSYDGIENLMLIEMTGRTDLLQSLSEEQLGFSHLRKKKMHKLEQMNFYALTPDCRLKILYGYFGESIPHSGTDFRCNHCDNCAPENRPSISPHVQSKRTEEFLKSMLSPTFKGEFFHGGIAISFHTTIAHGERHYTPLGELVHRYKYNGERELVDVLVAGILGRASENHLIQELLAVDLIVPVPSTKRDRHYDPVPLLAQHLSQKLGLPYSTQSLVKCRATLPQKDMTTPVQKKRNVAGAFRVINAEEIKGKVLLLVDDLFDSGMTVSECSRVLLQAGAKTINVLTLTKTSHV